MGDNYGSPSVPFAVGGTQVSLYGALSRKVIVFPPDLPSLMLSDSFLGFPSRFPAEDLYLVFLALYFLSSPFYFFSHPSPSVGYTIYAIKVLPSRLFCLSSVDSPFEHL